MCRVGGSAQEGHSESPGGNRHRMQGKGTRHKEKVLHVHGAALGQGWHHQPWKFSKPRAPQGNFEISSVLSGQVDKGPTKAQPEAPNFNRDAKAAY